MNYYNWGKKGRGRSDSFTGRYFCFLMGLLLVSLSFAAEAAAQDKFVNRETIYSTLQTSGQARIIVRFHTPKITELSAASLAVPVVIPGEKRTQAGIDADQSLAGEIAATVNRVLSALQGKTFAVLRRYETLPLLAMTVSKEALDTLESLTEVEAIFPDKLNFLPPLEVEKISSSKKASIQTEIIEPLLDNTVSIIGATTAWSRGFTGRGWYVAVLDTGIRSSHLFFSGKSLVEACFASGQYAYPPYGDCPNGLNAMTGPGSAAHYSSSYTGYDHGTHVSGIAAGKRADGTLYGIAKEAGIIAVKVFSRYNSSVGAYDSDIIAGLNYVYGLRNTYSIAAVNMSLGGGAYNNQGLCDSENAGVKLPIDNLRASRIATVIATGNDGYCGWISAPACISSAIAVGASTKWDTETMFNNWESTLQDIFAPGQDILSSTGASDVSYARWNGTSMATPHMAGAWAILRQNRPTATVDQILNSVITKGTSVPTLCPSGGSKPRINVNASLFVSISPILELLME
ncbi:MAG: S8 family serine peptidase [Thermodesulfobacteriota bacterium]